MRRYIVRRLLLMPFTLIGITFLVFSLSRLVPGGPVERMLQEQTMTALSGEKVSGNERVSEDDLERLEDMFGLREPIWKAYLQWLGVLPRDIQVERAEFNDEGTAYLTLTNSTGKSTVLEVHRQGTRAQYLTVPWMEEERWSVQLESPQQRAARWAARHGVEDETQIRKQAESAGCRRWRAVASRRVFDGLLQGSLGLSYKYHEPVGAMIRERLPVSLYFGLLGAFITYLVSVPLGVIKALHHRSWFDSLSSIAIFTGYAVPGFALGAVLLVYLGARLEWFPMYGLTGPGFADMPFWAQVSDLAVHTVLPLLCYVVSTFAMTTMMMKNSLMENISADYVRTAVAKGVSFRRAVWGHAFRNAFIPIASSLGGVICTVVSGSILIERVFDIQGFGLLSFQALMDKDYSLVMGTLLLTSVLIILGNLLSDMLVAVIDPRIKFDHA
ncbi:MAG: ABC transporter permease [Akkermansia sp.]|nr:ABC transporter permease [Akkermansia sp.]